ncbi:radical SAM protein [Thermosphaera chiliense]|uniref:Radical SAM protein n=1 Tax=Thermosphaera chiliense TaxID=3402707 RepID=A0A7M1UPR4_9CREN|nr:radical SAM protein [Thermosphaera aggregans]QOR94230.1 radical SAM protein [Thermosphaera aggregans]
MFKTCQIIKQRTMTALSRSGLPGLDYALNPYIGCMHACIYCYARLYTRDKKVSENWGRVVIVKENLLEVLNNEVKRLRRGVVGVGTITDAYQPVEAVYKLTREAVKILLKNGFKISIQTKNPLVLRDVDVLSAGKELVDIGFTITSIECGRSRTLEPNAPCPEARIEALRKLSRSGFNTWIFYGPIIPGFNDDEDTITLLVDIASETKSILYYDPLHFKPFMKSPSHPLHSLYASRAFPQRIRKTIYHLRQKCLERGIQCRGGFD